MIRRDQEKTRLSVSRTEGALFILWLVFFKRVAKVPAWGAEPYIHSLFGRLPSQMFELRFSASLETIDLEPREQTPRRFRSDSDPCWRISAHTPARPCGFVRQLSRAMKSEMS